jgi:hypothetical protein
MIGSLISIMIFGVTLSYTYIRFNILIYHGNTNINTVISPGDISSEAKLNLHVGPGQGLDFRLAFKVMGDNIKDLDKIGELIVVSHEVSWK